MAKYRHLHHIKGEIKYHSRPREEGVEEEYPCYRCTQLTLGRLSHTVSANAPEFYLNTNSTQNKRKLEQEFQNCEARL